MSNDYVKGWEAHAPVCFRREELHRTFKPELWPPDKALIESLLEEGVLGIETATVYWLRLTPKGEAELARLNREPKRRP